MAAGRFGGLRVWLDETLLAQGSLHATADDTLQAAIGAPLDPAPYLAALEAKYRALCSPGGGGAPGGAAAGSAEAESALD